MPRVSLDKSMRNLSQIYGISHPDELNHLQKRKLLTPMHAILGENKEAVCSSRGQWLDKYEKRR